MVAWNDQGGRVECVKHSTRRTKLMSEGALSEIAAYDDQIYVRSIDVIYKSLNNRGMLYPTEMNIGYVGNPCHELRAASLRDPRDSPERSPGILHR